MASPEVSRAARQALYDLLQLHAANKAKWGHLPMPPIEVQRMVAEILPANWDMVMMFLEVEMGQSWENTGLSADVLADQATEAGDVEMATTWHLVADYCRFKMNANPT
jgi:hypothetical protein